MALTTEAMVARNAQTFQAAKTCQSADHRRLLGIRRFLS